MYTTSLKMRCETIFNLTIAVWAWEHTRFAVSHICFALWRLAHVWVLASVRIQRLSWFFWSAAITTGREPIEDTRMPQSMCIETDQTSSQVRYRIGFSLFPHQTKGRMGETQSSIYGSLFFSSSLWSSSSSSSASLLSFHIFVFCIFIHTQNTPHAAHSSGSCRMNI